eukprot:gene16130-biopygen10989
MQKPRIEVQREGSSRVQVVGLEEVRRECSRREVACVACARRTWNDADRMKRLRLWDNRTPDAIARAKENWQRVQRCGTKKEREAEVEVLMDAFKGWVYDPDDGFDCCYETSMPVSTGDSKGAEQQRRSAYPAIAALLSTDG